MQVTVVSEQLLEPAPMTVIGEQFTPTRPVTPCTSIPRPSRSAAVAGSLAYNKVVKVSHRLGENGSDRWVCSPCWCSCSTRPRWTVRRRGLGLQWRPQEGGERRE